MIDIWDTEGGKLSAFTESKIYPLIINALYSYNSELDMKKATDLVTTYTKSVSFALRVRRPLITQHKPSVEQPSFTVRYCGRSGVYSKSELHKITTLSKEELPKLGFYGFMDSYMLGIGYYTIYDLHKLQDYLIKFKDKFITPEFVDKFVTFNRDGSAYTRFYWKQFPKDIIVVQKTNNELDYYNYLVNFLNNTPHKSYSKITDNLKKILVTIHNSLNEK